MTRLSQAEHGKVVQFEGRLTSAGMTVEDLEYLLTGNAQFKAGGLVAVTRCMQYLGNNSCGLSIQFAEIVSGVHVRLQGSTSDPEGIGIEMLNLVGDNAILTLPVGGEEWMPLILGWECQLTDERQLLARRVLDPKVWVELLVGWQARFYVEPSGQRNFELRMLPKDTPRKATGKIAQTILENGWEYDESEFPVEDVPCPSCHQTTVAGWMLYRDGRHEHTIYVCTNCSWEGWSVDSED